MPETFCTGSAKQIFVSSQTYDAVVMNYESVILALHMCTCLQVRIYQPANLALFHSLLGTYL